MHTTSKLLSFWLALALVVTLGGGDAWAKKRAKKKRRPKATVTKVQPAAPQEVAPTPTEPDADAVAKSQAVPNADAAPIEPSATASEFTPLVETAPAAGSGPEIIEAQAAGSPVAPILPVEVASAELPAAGATSGSSAQPAAWLVGVHAGAAVPGVVSKLDFGAAGGIDLGYILPWLEGRVQVYGRLDYLRPSYRTSAEDPRLSTSTTYSYKVIEEELCAGLGAVGRLWQPGGYLNVYGRLGGEVRMQRSTARGRATTSLFGENQETKTAMGLLLGGGGELLLGPGVVFGELDLSYADLSHAITGDTATGGLGLLVGYAMLF